MWYSRIERFENAHTCTCLHHCRTGAAAVAQAGQASGEESSSKVRELEVVCQVKQILLRTIFKRIIINPQGEIVDCDLHSPFAYLSALTSHCAPLSEEKCGSEQVRLGAYHPNKASQSSLDLEDLLAGLRFEQRSKLEELPVIVR
jgi:hypothetical protein